ncbi:hypothetical protein ACTXT7_008654 [Hymenolepis weldensis]
MKLALIDYCHILQRLLDSGDPLKSEDIDNEIKFSVMVLHSQAWPISKQEEVHLPIELEQCVRVYTEFYREHRPGTKLGWCFQVSHGDISPLYTKRRFTFEVSTFQIAILMLFNNANCYTVRQITQLTNIEEYQVIQILNYFLKRRILMVAESDGSEEQLTQQQMERSASTTSIPTLTEDTLITLYFNYTNKNTRVYLLFLSKSEEKAETEKATACIETDRKDIIGVRRDFLPELEGESLRCPNFEDAKEAKSSGIEGRG